MNTNNVAIPNTNRLFIIIAIMSATLMQVLDTTIVNVSLSHIQGSLNATPDRITWTLTSYLVASAIIMPLTGYFSDCLGRKNYLLWCVGGFTIASALCGMATSLTQIVSFRLLQGLFGAALVPLSQAIIIDAYPPKELGKAMAIWGTGVMVGPILGPVLGGYLTDIASWRWAFYVNIPVGIMAFLLTWKFVPNTAKKDRSFDWIGFALIAIAIGALQYFLDRGNQDDWFNARSIQIAAFFAISSLIGFIVYSYFHRGQTVFDISIFKDRNFTISSLLLLFLGVGLFGSMVILPLLLEGLFNYPVLITGLMMTPRAFSVMFSMIIIGKICHLFDPRKLIATGIIIGAIGTYSCTTYSLELSTWSLIWPSMIQGLGLGMIFIPLAATAFSTIDGKLRAEAAGINSLMRTLGGSIGIAITISIFSRHTQISWSRLTEFIHPYNPNLIHYLNNVQLPHTNPLLPLVNELSRQATMLSLLDVFVFIMYSFILMIPFVFLLKYKEKANKDNTEPHLGLE